MAFKYQLDTSSKKFVCPNCGMKRIVRYVAYEDGAYLNSVYGRCDREVKCGYHLLPGGSTIIKEAIQKPQKEPFFIAKDVFQKTLANYQHNNLFSFLSLLFDNQKAKDLVSIYQVGTSKHWEGATLFWQINSKGQIGQGKIMLFDKETGRRVKHPFPHISSVHRQLNKQDQRPEYCFFGEHLLAKFPNKPIAIVESEKTALIMTGFVSDYLWIASGGLSNLNSRRMKVFKNRKIVFYSDLGAFEKWNQKAHNLNLLGFDISASKLLEEKATSNDKREGFDIADYFIKNRLKRNEPNRELKRMLEKNPALQNLIDRFQLVL
ncbi:DUF6371 domain-containing protein [uncultured Sunxiuqinia sp.]|uniref:DUF6371 domain-containing protein n=1 Tax=uncultured Sunxiuqinia sp. TaxID=1573825 RepID=UPI002AA660C4|nr:DUF6371 domain-containing protein [uncultured Sunxiuqinia sp.]